jgi:ribosomal protein S17
LLTCCLTVVSVAACGRERPTRTFSQPAPEAKASAGPNAKGAVAAGTVTETMDAGGYTYVQVDTGSQKVWAAAPKFQVKVGDRVVVPEGAPMRNYHSKTLNRDFDVVYFASSIQNSTGGEMPKGSGVPSGRAPTTGSSSVAQVDVSGVEKAEGGLTVGELFAGKAELSGKEVTLRAKVVKFTPQVMGKNWLHVQDGSGDAAARTHDLTVTTDVTAKVGDTVLITGPVTLDKDFGAGYKYDVIIEDAKVTVE